MSNDSENTPKDSKDAYAASLEKCKPFKSKYDRCFNSWYFFNFTNF